MSWVTFRHEAMTTHFEVLIDGHQADYARQAATAVWREIDRLETVLSKFIPTSDISRANRLERGASTMLGEDAFECLVIAADVCLATNRTFDAAYATVRGPDLPADALPFTLDPETHAITSRAEQLALDLGAIGKGYAVDRAADLLREWGITTACVNSGGSTALALAAPARHDGWPLGIGAGETQHRLALVEAALSASGVAVKGAHVIDPRTGEPAARTSRTWALAPSAAVSDAVSTAFFVMTEPAIAQFCAEHPEIGAAIATREDELIVHGALKAYLPAGHGLK